MRDHETPLNGNYGYVVGSFNSTYNSNILDRLGNRLIQLTITNHVE